MIQLDDICLSFGQQVIFDHISCSISSGQKIGLVGRNGSGKTTLLKVIAGRQSLDSGKVSIPKSFRYAYMPQDVVLVSSKTIINEALSACGTMGKLLDELENLENYISQNEADEKMLEQYALIHQQLYEMDYEGRRAEAEKILVGLGFEKENLEMAVSSLSVGWKMRLVLAGLLLQKADFYLFDEPTNHLDLFAKDWFVDFLRTASFGFILVSHDEYFLDRACDYIAQISLGKLTMYRGGYSSYLQQKKTNELLLEKKYEEQQKYIKKQQATIERFRYKASKAKMAQSMIKSLEKIERINLEHTQKDIRFSLPPVKQSGKIVLNAKSLGFSFGQKKIFHNATFEVARGHKVAIVAPNGTGKSTLLNLIMEKYEPENGEFSFGYNVTPVFFEQDQNKSLNHKNTIIQEVELACHTSQERERVRGLLGAFLFSGDDIQKKIGVLSGGEKNRVAMVKILLKNANLLILDEPTNHLDIASKQVLLDVLSKFKGTIIFVSHDRTFLNNLATDILELTPNGTVNYAGNYDDFLYYKQHAQDEKKSVKTISKKNQKVDGSENGIKVKELRKQISKTEKTIKRLEDKVAKIEGQFATLSYGTPEYQAAVTKLQEVKQELQKQNDFWEQLMIEMELF